MTGEVKNGDYDELGEGIEVRHSSYIVYISEIVDKKGWDIHSSQ